MVDHHKQKCSASPVDNSTADFQVVDGDNLHADPRTWLQERKVYYEDIQPFAQYDWPSPDHRFE